MAARPRPYQHTGLTLVLAAAAAACGDTTGISGPGSVALNFRVGAAAPTASVVTEGGLAGAPARVAGPPMTLSGTNGELTIDEIRLIVAEVELDGEDDLCEDADGDGGDDSGGSSSSGAGDCAEFEAPPRFLDLPLDGEPVEAFVGLVPAGTYDELEFEIEDLEDDEDDTQFAAEIAALRETILDEFPDWPRKATALVAGSFTPTGGDALAFRVYIEAEIEIERPLSPPLVVGEDGDVGSDLTVDIRPDIWFTQNDGTVLDLTAYDYDETGQVLEFELEMENGFTELEIDDDR
jgi:hypothetical protein